MENLKVSKQPIDDVVEDGDDDYYDENDDVPEDDFDAHHFSLSLHNPAPFSIGPLRSHNLVVRIMKITILVLFLRMMKRVTIILMVSMIHDHLFDGFDHPRPFFLWFAIPTSYDTVPFPFCSLVNLPFCNSFWENLFLARDLEVLKLIYVFI